jgi:multimeric flavodoxin WrbA
MKEADVIILAIPTYGGKPAALYSAFTERAQGIFKGYEEFKNTILNKIIALIVIGNVPAGGDLTYHSVILDHYDCKKSTAFYPASISRVWQRLHLWRPS